MPAGRLRLVAVLSVLVTVVAGCGSGGTGSTKPAARATPPPGTTPTATTGRDSQGSGTQGTSPHGSGTQRGTSPPISGRIVLPAPPPTGKPAPAASVRVIRGWADTLRHGDVRGAGRYFAVPSEMINGPDANGTVSVIHIHSRVAAAAANASLPCGARLLSTDQRGIYVNALFALTSRPGVGGGCQGTTGTGRVNFVVRGGLIARWIRAPDEQGDAARGGGTPPPANTTPPPSTNGAPNAPVV